MIHAKRLPCPTELSQNNTRWRTELCKKWQQYQDNLRQYEAGGIPIKPKRPEATKSRYATTEVKRLLRQMAGAKCCYCEAKVGVTSPSHVEHFRPQSIYPSLAYEWSNLLLACSICNSEYKRDQFVVGTAEKWPVLDPAAPCALNDSDEAMLVDPSREEPGDHFDYYFDEHRSLNQIIVTLKCTTRRGAITRDICGLDREYLVEDMCDHLMGLQEDVDSYKLAIAAGNSNERSVSRRRLVRAWATNAEYCAMTRAYLRFRGVDFDQE